MPVVSYLKKVAATISNNIKMDKKLYVLITEGMPLEKNKISRKK